jgi:hypothetical protein
LRIIFWYNKTLRQRFGRSSELWAPDFEYQPFS